ncbi:MAG: PKD domain-containing protein, partial [Crocinitomicaceae bacterium]|nr:PKD domain-containing protein [Crocinitomicaceae bacterium]
IWDFGDGNQTTGCGVVSNTYTTSGSFDVSLFVTNSVGCSSTETYTNYINVHPIPLAAFNLNPEILNINDLEAHCINNSINATNFVWDFGDGTQGTLENPIHLFPDIPNSHYTVTLHATSEFNCTDSTQRTIQVQDVLLYYVPNAFTPDDDEFNQTFQPVFTSGFDPLDFRLLIFDRWGEVIFESRDTEHGWDGTYGGKTVQQGVYTWTIEFKETMTDKRHKVSGHVNILH